MSEQYSFDRAESEASEMKKRIEGGKALDYAAAERQIELESGMFGKAVEFWGSEMEKSDEVRAGMTALGGYGEKVAVPEKVNEIPNLAVLLAGDQKTAESFAYPWAPMRRAYGALPNFDQRSKVVADFSEEAKFFGKHHKTGEGPAWRDPSFAEGAMLFELKFGKKLSEFVEEILAHYPDLKKKGKDISVFGLSGSGKSTACEAIRQEVGGDAVIMDSDTVRYNLLARMVKDVETKNGADLNEVRDNLMHNNVSGSLYFAMGHIAKELKDRGYTVISSSTGPTPGADHTFYVQHPDGVDPTKLSTDAEREEVAKKLFARTQQRTSGADDYDWDNAETVTDFRKMKSVTVQVPQRVHGMFLKSVKGSLESQPNIKVIENPLLTDSKERDENFRRQFKSALET